MSFVEEKVRAEQEEKRRQWEEIKQRSPDLAKFLILFNKHFGTPKSLEVKFLGK